jgi:NADH-quinone oxidoreductase subunit E
VVVLYVKGGHMNITEIIQKYPKKQEYLIEMLLDVEQVKEHHFISELEVYEIAKYIGVKESHVCSVMSFYTLLSMRKRGKNIIQVCQSVPCYLCDTFNVLQTIKDALGIDLDQTTEDNMFTLENTACIGCCDEAPAVRINNKVYTNLTKQKVLKILESYRGDAA